ncbi:Fic family protein [Curtobacterium sp. PhB78]|uniref:Fic family protein n=1 Tax=Curtobacterium sp. PhB78 TaxID=2485102 RepID=UPI000F4AA2CD|nr:Fic family protein [Curtobacterium sp. PhB78]ROS35239.1 Fic/DOC family protein [Curtobacterium sp. PhB78]
MVHRNETPDVHDGSTALGGQTAHSGVLVHRGWPVHGSAERPWRSASRGSRADRMTTSVRVSLPPRIARARWEPDARTEALLDRAAAALRSLDVHHGSRLAPLGSVIGRTEAVASSRIEDESASLDDCARALVGIRANPSATVVVRAAGAIEGLVAAADTGVITEAALLEAHRLLMRDDPVDGRYAGRYRSVQNWIGGGDTPRLATYVPPPPDLVAPLMADLFAFLHRTDLHPIAQAAIGHAQFESIHPFTDGNGRIGRALISAVLRRRGVTTTVTAPIATALAADRGRYFRHLARYRDGVVDALVTDVAIAIGTVCDEATVTALLLDEHAADRMAGPCATSVHAVVGRALSDDPVLTEARLQDLLAGVDGGPVDEDPAGSVAADLVRAGVLRPVTERRRDRAWVAPAVVDELEAFEQRVRAGVAGRTQSDRFRAGRSGGRGPTGSGRRRDARLATGPCA